MIVEVMGMDEEQVVPVKADATALPFKKVFLIRWLPRTPTNCFVRDPETP